MRALTRLIGRVHGAVTRYAVVTTTTLSAVEPTAQHSGVLEQAMSDRDRIPLGRVCVAQVLPPPVVATTTPPEEEEFWRAEAEAL